MNKFSLKLILVCRVFVFICVKNFQSTTSKQINKCFCEFVYACLYETQSFKIIKKVFKKTLKKFVLKTTFSALI